MSANFVSGDKPDADTRAAPHARDRIDDLDHDARAVLDGAAVAVGALVGLVGEELLQQVAVGGVDLDAVEAGILGAFGGVCVVGDDAGDLFGLERARRDERLETLVGVGLLAFGAHRARRHGELVARLNVGVGDAAHVPELQEDVPALVVHRLGGEAPAGDLLWRPDAGRADVALALGADVGGFRDDEAGGGTLSVVGRLQLAGDAGIVGTRAGQRRHDDAI